MLRCTHGMALAAHAAQKRLMLVTPDTPARGAAYVRTACIQARLTRCKQSTRGLRRPTPAAATTVHPPSKRRTRYQRLASPGACGARGARLGPASRNAISVIYAPCVVWAPAAHAESMSVRVYTGKLAARVGCIAVQTASPMRTRGYAPTRADRQAAAVIGVPAHVGLRMFSRTRARQCGSAVGVRMGVARAIELGIVAHTSLAR